MNEIKADLRAWGLLKENREWEEAKREFKEIMMFCAISTIGFVAVSFGFLITNLTLSV